MMRLRHGIWVVHNLCADAGSVLFLFGQSPGPDVKGRPRDSWQTLVHKDLSDCKVELRYCKLAQDRVAGGQMIAPS